MIHAYPEIEQDYEMGKVVTAFKVQNWGDIERLAVGDTDRPPRTYEGEAVIDTGAVHLYLKKSVIEQLGLRPIRTWRSRTMSNLIETRRVFSPVDCEVMGRNGTFDVIEVPDDLPNIIGQIPLEHFDWVIDMKNRKLIGNPEHGGEWIDECFACWDGANSR